MNIINNNALVFNYIEEMTRENYSCASDESVLLNANDIKFSEFQKMQQANPKIIVYNYEQLSLTSKWWNPNYQAILKSAYKIWDYNKENIEFLKQFGIAAEYKPVKPTQSLKRLPKKDRDIDVLFFGALTERRVAYLRSIMKQLPGVRFEVAQFVYGKDLEDLIARTKLILNIHAFDAYRNQEIVRFLFPLMNNKCILTEHSDNDEYAGNSVLYSDVENMPDAIKFILDNKLYDREVKFV